MTYQEYPKCVGYEADGKTMIVANSREEEDAYLQSLSQGDGDEKARLIGVAEANGVQVDKRWSAQRLAKVLADAGIEPDAAA